MLSEASKERKKAWTRARWARRTPEEIERDRERERDHREANKQGKHERDARWRTVNRERINTDQKHKYHQLTPSKKAVRLEGVRANSLKQYGITIEQYEAILLKQHNGCALCHRTAEGNGRRLAVDHCHLTGRVRGLLCISCNRALATLGDTADALRRAVCYLEHPPAEK